MPDRRLPATPTPELQGFNECIVPSTSSAHHTLLPPNIGYFRLPPRTERASRMDGRMSDIGPGRVTLHLAQVREQAVLGWNCILGRGACIGLGVELEHDRKLQNYAPIYEFAPLEDGAFVGPAVLFTSDTLPRAVDVDGTRKAAEDWDAAGALVRTGASIGARAVCIAAMTIGAMVDGRWSLPALP